MLAQFTEAQTEIPIKFSLLAEQVSLPTFQDYGSNWGYGFSIGSEFKYTSKYKIDLVQTGDIYFYSHGMYGTSFVLATLFDVRYKPGRFNADFKVGPGFMLFDHFSSVYKQGNGKYEKALNLQSKFSAILSVALAYRIQDYKPFIAYDFLAEIPFINTNSAFLPHQILQIGCYYNFKLKKYED